MTETETQMEFNHEISPHKPIQVCLDYGDEESAEESAIWTIQYLEYLHTLANMIEDLGESDEVVKIPVSGGDNNQEITGIGSDINETGNGLCPKTMDLFVDFANNFPYSDPDHNKLFNSIYENENYEVTREDFTLPFLKSFFEKFDPFNSYPERQLVQSLLLASNFFDFKLLMRIMIFKYRNLIEDFYIMSEKKYQELVVNRTSEEKVPDETDFVAEEARQFFGIENTWTPEEYQKAKQTLTLQEAALADAACI